MAKHTLAALALLGALGGTAPCHANSEPFVGQVMCGGWNFAPQGWMELAGQTLSIADNEVLFFIIGTTWGGDGQTTFALPDLRGRAIVGQGQAPGRGNYLLGDVGGTESITIGAAQMPIHSHSFQPRGSSLDATAKSPAGSVPASKARTTLYAPGPGDVAMQGVQSSPAGGGQPVERLQPYLPMKCAVAVFGIFPAQN